MFFLNKLVRACIRVTQTHHADSPQRVPQTHHKESVRLTARIYCRATQTHYADSPKTGSFQAADAEVSDAASESVSESASV